MYLKREIEQEVLEMVGQYPVLTITGPRQSGKTTLVKHLFGYLPYYNFESPDTRRLVESDPRAFLQQNQKGAILDEIQNIPELISYLQQVVDENRDNLKFILTGSNQFSLMDSVTQSLAGRTAIIKLLPLSLAEIGNSFNISTDDLIFKGFYPGVYSHNLSPHKAYRNYYETYIERDLHKLIKVKDLSQFQHFVRIFAGRVGNLVNLSAIAGEIGASVGTIKAWITILEASYIVYLLHPYSDNRGKRLIKSPKVYFYDVGLLSFLLGIEDTNQLSRDPLRGAIFENMIVMELMKMRFNKGLDTNMFFYRDSNHSEIDIVISRGRLLQPVEVKSSKTFHPDFLKQFTRFQKTLPDRIIDPLLIYDGDLEQKVQGIEVVNYRRLSELF
ncbi:MAG: ATP-binding protein [Lentimicrobium sp.]|jgi:predicted AAA+ superfamily ATPase|nr:ATP-binding protein [Lentimicrobium sp.]